VLSEHRASACVCAQQQQYGQYGGGGKQYGKQYGKPQQPQFAQPATHEVRPIRVQSEVISGHQKQSETIIGNQWPSVAINRN
jgi:hypothetical protein